MWGVIVLALGAGAIAQVVYEVGRLIVRQSREDGAPVLGTWQAIYLFEHRDEPHRRTIVLHLIGE